MITFNAFCVPYCANNTEIMSKSVKRLDPLRTNFHAAIHHCCWPNVRLDKSSCSSPSIICFMPQYVLFLRVNCVINTNYALEGTHVFIQLLLSCHHVDKIPLLNPCRNLLDMPGRVMYQSLAILKPVRPTITVISVVFPINGCCCCC